MYAQDVGVVQLAHQCEFGVQAVSVHIGSSSPTVVISLLAVAAPYPRETLQF